jgi:PAS domain S-box-containing protein
MRRELARRARSVVETISPDNVRKLSFSSSDVTDPEFQRLSAQLRLYANAAGLRSIYTMALRDGNLVFGPESLSPGDPYASLPGTVYQNPTQKDLDIFQTGKATVQGPATDEYGDFVTASVPVIDPRSGKVLITVGLDREASVWRTKIRKAQWTAFLTAMIPLGLLIAGYFVMKIRQRLARTHHKRLRHTEAVTCAVIMLLLTAIAAKLIHNAEKESREDMFQAQAKFRASRYIETFKTLRSSLYMLARFFESSEFISRKDFQSYCEPLLENNPIQACLWMPKIPAEELDDFTQTVRTEDFSEFSVWQFNEQEQTVSAQSAEHYPALYIEPLPDHKTSLGYDLYSEPLRRKAITEALRVNRGTATDPVNGIAPSGKPSAFLIFKPISTTLRSGIAGFAVRPDILLASQLHNPAGETPGLSVSLFQLRPGQSPYWLSCSRTADDRNCWEVLQTGLHATIPVFAFGKTYSLLIAPEPQWFTAHPLRRGKTALIIGLILTVLITTLIATLSNRPALLEKQVQQRTAELRESEERFEIAADAAGFGVWDRDLTDNRLIWDERMYALYGVRSDEFSGTREAWQKYLHPDDLASASAAVSAAEQGLQQLDTEFRIIRPDGELRYMRVCAKMTRDEFGHPIRMTGVNYDITKQKLAEERILSQLDELNRWYKATLGRETRVLELKKEINEILQQNGTPPRYNETSENLNGED